MAEHIQRNCADTKRTRAQTEIDLEILPSFTWPTHTLTCMHIALIVCA